MPSSVEELMYNEAVRGVDIQARAVDALRSRAGTLLAAAALVTTFLGGRVLDDGRGLSSVGVIIALGTFVALAICTVFILLPHKFHWTFDPESLVSAYVDADPPVDLPAALRDLALHHHQSTEKNNTVVERLHLAFRIACGMLGIEVFAWLWVL